MFMNVNNAESYVFAYNLSYRRTYPTRPYCVALMSRPPDRSICNQELNLKYDPKKFTFRKQPATSKGTFLFDNLKVGVDHWYKW